MTLIRGSDGILHSIFTLTTTEYLSKCGVFHKRGAHTRTNTGVVTCLRCVASYARAYTEAEERDHG